MADIKAGFMRFLSRLRSSLPRLVVVAFFVGLSGYHAWHYSFKADVKYIAAFGVASAAFWLVAALVHIAVPSPPNAPMSNADMANAIAAVAAACLVFVSMDDKARAQFRPGDHRTAILAPPSN
jgi:hypothetical protein